MAFLGLDVAKDKVDCCLLSDNGKKLERNIVRQSMTGFSDLQKWLNALGHKLNGLVAVLEPTGVYGYKLTHWLYDNKASVRLVHPTQARFFARYHKMNSKNDEIDSLMLAKMGKEQTDELPEWKPLPVLYERLQNLIRRLDQVVKARQREKNHLEGHKGIESFKAPDEYITEAIQFYDAQEEKITDDICRLIAQDPKLNADVKLLKTVPGIGKKIASILAILFNTKYFSSAAQAAKFVGLIPKENKSGSSVNSPSRMSKAGSASIRSKLYMGASAVIRVHTHGSRLKRFHQGLVERGMHEKAAKGALMHKILVVAYGVWNSQLPYDDDYEAHRMQNKAIHANCNVSDTAECEESPNTTGGASDSPCSERKRAHRPSRTRSEEHRQVEGVKATRAKRASLEEVALTPKTPVLPLVKQGQGALKRRTRKVNS